MTLKEIQAVSLEILKDVHTFCQENGIRYTLYGGTMIGAIRHQGFIPWDDDVDIAMPRPDYERFLETYQSKNNRYKLFRSGDKDCLLAFSRVCEMDKTLVEVAEMPWTKEQTGVWIDVFPVDGVTDSAFWMRPQFKICRFLWYLCCSARASLTPLSHYKSKAKKAKLVLKKIFLNNVLLNAQTLNKVYISYCKCVEWGSTYHVANLSYMGYGIKELQEIDDFRSDVLVPFAGERLFVIEGYDHSMRLKYGDYMQLPPEEKQNPNHPLVTYCWKV